MPQPPMILTTALSEDILADIERRDVALWLQCLPSENVTQENLLAFLGLPWKMILSESSEPNLLSKLDERTDSFHESMTQRRGYIQIIDSDPSRLELPRRCLPFYLLNGRQGSPTEDFHSKFRRMAMIEALRRSDVSRIFVLSGDGDTFIPIELRELWSSGFRSYLTFATDAPEATSAISRWIKRVDDLNAITLLRPSVEQVISELLRRFSLVFPSEKVIVRLRNRAGTTERLDITDLDDPERPLLDRYEILQERNLSLLIPEQLSAEEFSGFFENPHDSWLPYAAELPWRRDNVAERNLKTLIQKLDAVGPSENCIAYITAEPGAGGTTLARMLAWKFAHVGYPVLVAKSSNVVPDSLSLANFLNRIRLRHESETHSEARPGECTDGAEIEQHSDTIIDRYEVPWIIVFDRIHWESRGVELRRFRNEMEKQGRPVCLLVISGPIRELAYFDASTFHEITELNHSLSREEVRELGQHLNQFLRVHGAERSQWQWDTFFENHSVQYTDGVSAFWVTLSFWIQGQYDLTESIQEWMYRHFKTAVSSFTLRMAILEIAALSSERLSMPAVLLHYATR